MKPNERGIIYPDFCYKGFSNEKSSGGSISNTRNPALLRYFSLYWDKLAIVTVGRYGFNIGREERLLASAGVLSGIYGDEPPREELHGSEYGKRMNKSMADASITLMNSEKGKWAIHPLGTDFRLNEDDSIDLSIAEFELIRCLPVPSSDTPIDRVLDFKIKRNSELLALRASLDELYLEIANSNDVSRAKSVQVTKLKIAIENLNKVANENWSQRILASRKVAVNLKSSNLASSTLFGSSVAIATEPIYGLIAGSSAALVSSLNISLQISPQQKGLQCGSIDLSYLASLHKSDLL